MRGWPPMITRYSYKLYNVLAQSFQQLMVAENTRKKLRSRKIVGANFVWPRSSTSTEVVGAARKATRMVGLSFFFSRCDCVLLGSLAPDITKGQVFWHFSVFPASLPGFRYHNNGFCFCLLLDSRCIQCGFIASIRPYQLCL